MKLSEDQIRQIVDQLDAGFRCYVHKLTLEIITIPNDSNYPDMDFSFWKNDIKKIESKRDQYTVIDPLETKDSFKMMAEFSSQLEDGNLKSKLISALTHSKPFKHFKFVIDNSGGFRQQWFDFKNVWLQEWVREQISTWE